MTMLQVIKAALIDGLDEEVVRLAREALESDISAHEILNGGFSAGMAVVGEYFQKREFFLPDVLMAARAMKAGMEVLRPLLEGEALETKGTVVIGTVKGDVHDIGKNLVGILLRGAGFDVVDVGNDASVEQFVDAVQMSEATVLGLSALLTTTMPQMEEIIKALEKAGLGHVKTMVGGAPVTDGFADSIGADAYGNDAVKAMQLASSWIE